MNSHQTMDSPWLKKKQAMSFLQIVRSISQNHSPHWFYKVAYKLIHNPWDWNICFYLHIVDCYGKGKQTYLGFTPHPATVTTRIIIFWVGDPYKPLFGTGILIWGKVDPENIPFMDPMAFCVKHRRFWVQKVQRTSWFRFHVHTIGCPIGS